MLLVGCGRAPTSGPAPGTTPTDSAVVDAPPPGPEPAGAEGEDPPALPTVVALDAEGLRFVEPTTGSTRLLAFGTGVDQAVAAVARSRGEPRERATLADCGLDFASWPGGLTVYATGGQFVGWAASEPAPGAGGDADPARAPTTMASVGVGSARADLDGAYDARVTATTLGSEFEAGGIHGVLSGPGPEGRVTSLWAGTSCVFR